MRQRRSWHTIRHAAHILSIWTVLSGRSQPIYKVRGFGSRQVDKVDRQSKVDGLLGLSTESRYEVSRQCLPICLRVSALEIRQKVDEKTTSAFFVYLLWQGLYTNEGGHEMG